MPQIVHWTSQDVPRTSLDVPRTSLDVPGCHLCRLQGNPGAKSKRLAEGDRRLGGLADVDGVLTIDVGPALARGFRPLNTAADLESWRASAD